VAELLQALLRQRMLYLAASIAGLVPVLLPCDAAAVHICAPAALGPRK
jgi:hypothetical protein